MGDLLCRLTYFRYTGAISERNMDRRLRNGEMALRKWDGGEIVECQLVSGIGSVVSTSGKY